MMMANHDSYRENCFETTLIHLTERFNGKEVYLIGTMNQSTMLAQRTKKLIEELKLQQSAAFDQDKSAQLGKQLGVGYFVTGKVSASDEKTDGERRLQYFLYMQVVEVETGAVRWQNKAELTKGLIK